MFASLYIKKQLARLQARTGVRLESWETVKQLAELKQMIVPSAIMFYVGEPTLQQYFGVEDQTLSTKQRVLQVAGSLAASYRSPIFEAITKVAQETGLPLREIETDVVSESGLIGKLDRAWYVLGDTECMQAESIELGVTIKTLAHQFELDGKFTVFLAQKLPKRLLGIFACEYAVAPGVSESIQSLRGAGVEVVLLTKARTSIAKGIGTRLSLSLIHSELRPGEKERILYSLFSQQPASVVLGGSIGKGKVPAVIIGMKPDKHALITVPDFTTLATLVLETRTLVHESKQSVLWRNL
jgi:hypothetical protein